MIVQSGSGKAYAVLAHNHEYELALLPQLQLVSTSVFLAVRCRYKALVQEVFNPMLCPKQVLVGGIERSKNTLRGTIMLNTGFTVDKLGKGFPHIAAEKLLEAAPEFLLTEDSVLKAQDVRGDFAEDFAKLTEPVMAPLWPAKDFSSAPDLITAFDLAIFTEQAEANPAAPFQVVTQPKKVEPDNVTKVKFGGDHEPQPPAPDEQGGEVDSQPSAGDVGGKVHVTGQAPTEEEPAHEDY